VTSSWSIFILLSNVNDYTVYRYKKIVSAEPNFTIPLVDKHMDNNGELTWTCEAFGIPDVNYTWFRNGEVLDVRTLPMEDRDRYIIVDNVLTIKYLKPDRDQAMYQCRARNILKAKYSSAQLRILCKYHIVRHPCCVFVN